MQGLPLPQVIALHHLHSKMVNEDRDSEPTQYKRQKLNFALSKTTSLSAFYSPYSNERQATFFLSFFIFFGGEVDTTGV